MRANASSTLSMRSFARCATILLFTTATPMQAYFLKDFQEFLKALLGMFPGLKDRML